MFKIELFFGNCTFSFSSCKSQRAAFPIYDALEISTIGAETVKPRQLEDDHQFNDIYHDIIFLPSKCAGNACPFPEYAEFCSLAQVYNCRADHIRADRS
jgi:hypothetical protein